MEYFEVADLVAETAADEEVFVEDDAFDDVEAFELVLPAPGRITGYLDAVEVGAAELLWAALLLVTLPN